MSAGQHPQVGAPAGRSQVPVRGAPPAAPVLSDRRGGVSAVVRLVQLAEPVRTRRVYEITPAGRAAFRAWLTTPPAPPALEAEALLRLLFADQGDRRLLLATMETLAKQTQALYDDGMQILAGYAEGTAPFPDRLHLSVLFAAFQTDLYRLILDWAQFAGREVRSWERTDGLGRTERVQEILETLLAGRSALNDPA